MKSLKGLIPGIAILVAGCATPVRQSPAVIQPPMPPPVEQPVRGMAAMSSAVVTTPPEILVGWKENDPIQRVVEYKVYLRGSNDWISVEHVPAPPIDIYPRLLTASNGVYRVSVSAVNSANLESKESPFVLFWHGHPTEPEEITVEFKR